MQKVKKYIQSNEIPIDFFGFNLSKYIDLIDVLDSSSSKFDNTTPSNSLGDHIRVVHSEPIFRDVCFDFKSNEPFDIYDPIARFYIKPTFLDLDINRQNKILSIVIYKTLLEEYTKLYSTKDLDVILYRVANTDKESLFRQLDNMYCLGIKKDENRPKIKDITKYLFKKNI
jgi:hypothetical protein